MDMQLVDQQRVVPGERFAECVDGRRADVAEDDADGTDGELVSDPLWSWPCEVSCGASASAPPVSVTLILVETAWTDCEPAYLVPPHRHPSGGGPH